MEIITKERIYINKSPVRVLVVDDREENLFSFEAILEKDGYAIVKAKSGRETLKILLKEFDFSLILMDVQMPEMDGFETATLIYQSEKLKNIPIIFITANDKREESLFKGYQAGGVDYIYKPVNPDLLRAKVSVFVELHKKRKQLIDQEQKLLAANKKLEREIEERKVSETKINMLNIKLMENISQLKATNEELERFAYIASHDLQEPLRKIILFGDRLENKYGNLLEGEGRDFLHRMMRGTERLQMLIKNLLAFSRSSANTESFELTDLNLLVDNVVQDMEVYVEQKRALFHISTLPHLYVVPGQFRQVFQNLLINALKFSKENVPPVINIYAEFEKGKNIAGLPEEKIEDDYCRIFVADNGMGFEQKYADEIFMLFKRLHSNDEFEGTGLGLSICKKIVEKHNGIIAVKSEPGEGATFIITLPLKQPITNSVIA